jgi:hypothetical protein
MSTEECCWSARAELPFGSSILHRSATSSSRKTRARGLRRHPSGRKLRRGRFRPINTPRLRGCGYKTAPGRSNWPNRDPIEENGGLNLYNYTLNEPVSKFDPDGREPWIPYPPGYWIPDPPDILEPVNHLIKAGYVPRCHVAIYLGHNRSRPPHVPKAIRNDPCSASVAACDGGSVPPVELEILGIEPRPARLPGGTFWQLLNMLNISAKYQAAAVRESL